MRGRGRGSRARARTPLRLRPRCVVRASAARGSIASSSGVRELERRKRLQRRSSCPPAAVAARRAGSPARSRSRCGAARARRGARRRRCGARARAARRASCRSPDRGSARAVLASAERAARDRIERVVLALQSPLAASATTDLDHRLAAAAEVASETGAVVAGAFDRPDTRARRVSHRQSASPLRSRARSIATDRCATTPPRRGDDDREHVLITVSVNTDDVIHLVCKHPV